MRLNSNMCPLLIIIHVANILMFFFRARMTVPPSLLVQKVSELCVCVYWQ